MALTIMNILLTGHNGFIGQNLYKALLKLGHNVDGWDWGDGLTPSAPYPQIAGRDVVIHLGAISSTTYPNVDQIFTQNTDFSIWLYDQCQAHNIDFHYASSASVYGTLNHFNEAGPFQPQSPYAYSKYLFDRHIMQNPAEHIKVIGFRYFNVYGHYGETHKGDMASPYTKFIKQAKEQGAIKLFEDSDQYSRDFISVEDVVKIHCTMINNAQSGIYNIGTGKPVSFQVVAESIADKYNAQITYVPMPNNLKQQYQKYTCADLTRLKPLIDHEFQCITEYINSHN